jgi:arylsulfatase A-like enzyme
MTDTQRLDDMGAYGNPVIKTPNLDRLANTGVKFNSCYTQYPACMPARAVIFTGRYPMANGVWSNGVPLPNDETTIAHVFAANGYRTGGAGKFHFLPHYPYQKTELPTMKTHPEPFYGFQEFHLGEDGRSGEHHQWIKENYPEYAGKPDHQIPIELHNTYWSAQHTIDFIKKCNENDEPFFAFCSFVDPHQGYNPPSPYREMYDEADMPDPIRREGELEGTRFESMANKGAMKRHTDRLAYMRTQHYGEMTFIDDQVGRMVETVETLNLRDNTIIAFISDHGDMLGDHWLWWKGPFHYAGCTNVPFFINGPGIQQGKTANGICQQTDVMPTLLELAGLEIPLGVQGKSLQSIATTDETETGYDYAYMVSVSNGAYSPDYLGKSKRPEDGKITGKTDTLTIRNHQWRFTYYTHSQDGELYDLENDPNEFTNLWDDPKYREKREELMMKLMTHTASARDPLPLRTRPY